MTCCFFAYLRCFSDPIFVDYLTDLPPTFFFPPHGTTASFFKVCLCFILPPGPPWNSCFCACFQSYDLVSSLSFSQYTFLFIILYTSLCCLLFFPAEFIRINRIGIWVLGVLWFFEVVWCWGQKRMGPFGNEVGRSDIFKVDLMMRVWIWDGFIWIKRRGDLGADLVWFWEECVSSFRRVSDYESAWDCVCVFWEWIEFVGEGEMNGDNLKCPKLA
jgi:hypothetical protein